MALPTNHPLLRENFATVYCPSIGSSPVAAYIRVPYRARIGKVSVIPQGTITTATVRLRLQLTARLTRLLPALFLCRAPHLALQLSGLPRRLSL